MIFRLRHAKPLPNNSLDWSGVVKKILIMIFAAVLAGCGGGASNDNGASGTVNSGGTTTSTAGTTTSTATGTTTTTGAGATTTTVSGTTTTTSTIGGTTGAATTRMMLSVTGKCLAVTGGSGATGNGVPIEQSTCSSQSNQAWIAKDMGDSIYEFISSSSGKCMTAAGDNPNFGTPIQQIDCTGQPNQLWRLGYYSPRRFQLRSVVDIAHCLSVRRTSNFEWPTNDGAVAELGSCGLENDPTIAMIMDVALPIKVLRANSNVVSGSDSDEKCLDVKGGVQATADGASIEVWSCTGLANQLWTTKDMGNGQYQFVASHSGKCLNLVGNSTDDGTKLQQSQCANTPTQLWTTEIPSFSGGSIFSITRIKSVASNAVSCLDIVGGADAAADGVLAQLIKCTGTQDWTIAKPAYWP
jgi:hypothetical protein